MFAYDLYSCGKVPSYTSLSKGHCDGRNCPNTRTRTHACTYTLTHAQTSTHTHTQVPLASMQSLEPVDVALYGKEVCADVIKVKLFQCAVYPGGP